VKQIASSTGRGGLTQAGKKEIAQSMFDKGCAFVGAYILLRQNDKSEPTEYVALHNLCQGFEIVLKSVLLMKNYERWQPRLKTQIGHDLLKLANTVVGELNLRGLTAKSKSEVQELTKFYQQNRLRYGSGLDLFIDPKTISRRRTVRLLLLIIKLGQAHLKPNPLK
jgi:hypothetical protein